MDKVQDIGIGEIIGIGLILRGIEDRGNQGRNASHRIDRRGFKLEETRFSELEEEPEEAGDFERDRFLGSSMIRHFMRTIGDDSGVKDVRAMINKGDKSMEPSFDFT